jgi:hypothetical protein
VTPDVETEWSTRLMQNNGSARHWTARVITAFVLVAVAVPVSAGIAAASDDRPGPCALTLEEGETVQANSRELIRCAVKRWDVPGGAAVALCIARRESGLIPWAESGDGLNKGLYQQHVNYWSRNYDNYTAPNWELKRNILNGRTNAIVSIRMAHDIGWGPWGGRDCS